MAAPCNLLRSMGCRLHTYTRVVRDNRFAVARLPVVCHGRRALHSDSSDAAGGSSSSASQAETTPVVIDNDLISKLLKDMEGNMPVSEMDNPFEKEHKRCILCKHNVDVNYKNVRLLSQFVSPFTGRIYGRQITGLCIPMQKQVARVIKQSRVAGYMPFMHKQPEYMKDPRLFDPFKQNK